MKKTACYVAVIVLTAGSVFAQTYNVLWNFGGAPNDGAGPVSNLVADKAGNLYGTTQFGGNATSFMCVADGGCGTIFELSPNGEGGWVESVLYSFCTNYQNNACLDGSFPKAGLAFDAAGNLYGTTTSGGVCNALSECGVVFELSAAQTVGNPWTETVLYEFCSNDYPTCLDGSDPAGHLTFDSSGNLYGTTTTGGGGAWLGVQCSSCLRSRRMDGSSSVPLLRKWYLHALF